MLKKRLTGHGYQSYCVMFEVFVHLGIETDFDPHQHSAHSGFSAVTKVCPQPLPPKIHVSRQALARGSDTAQNFKAQRFEKITATSDGKCVPNGGESDFSSVQDGSRLRWNMWGVQGGTRWPNMPNYIPGLHTRFALQCMIPLQKDVRILNRLGCW